MKQEKPSVLAMNGGSSSIKFALYVTRITPAITGAAHVSCQPAQEQHAKLKNGKNFTPIFFSWAMPPAAGVFNRSSMKMFPHCVVY